MNLDRMTAGNLLALHAEVSRRLRTLGVCRSANNPVADYAEWLCSRRLQLELVTKSTAGHDAVDSRGKRYEIKARRRTAGRPPSHFSAIRGLSDRHFDYFVGILFAEDFTVERAAILPFRAVTRIARFRKHVNGNIVYLRDFWSAPAVRDVAGRLQVG